MLRVGIFVSGGGTNLQAILDKAEAGDLPGVSIEVVVSNNKNAQALERAKKHKIPAVVISPKDYDSREQFNEAFLNKVNEYRLDLIVLAGFLVVIPPKMIEEYQNKIINVHPSLIPSFCGTGYYGLKVHQVALDRGVKLTGATVHYVDNGTDTGPIILQKAVKVMPGDTPQVLQKRVMEEAEWILLPQAIREIAEQHKKQEEKK